MLLNGAVFGRKSTQWGIKRELEMVVSGGQEEGKQLRGFEWRRMNRNKQTLEAHWKFEHKSKRTSNSENVNALWMGTDQHTCASKFFFSVILAFWNLYRKSVSLWNVLGWKEPWKKGWLLGRLCCSCCLFSSPAFLSSILTILSLYSQQSFVSIFAGAFATVGRMLKAYQLSLLPVFFIIGLGPDRHQMNLAVQFWEL